MTRGLSVSAVPFREMWEAAGGSCPEWFGLGTGLEWLPGLALMTFVWRFMFWVGKLSHWWGTDPVTVVLQEFVVSHCSCLTFSRSVLGPVLGIVPECLRAAFPVGWWLGFPCHPAPLLHGSWVPEALRCWAVSVFCVCLCPFPLEQNLTFWA